MDGGGRLSYEVRVLRERDKRRERCGCVNLIEKKRTE